MKNKKKLQPNTMDCTEAYYSAIISSSRDILIEHLEKEGLDKTAYDKSMDELNNFEKMEDSKAKKMGLEVFIRTLPFVLSLNEPSMARKIGKHLKEKNQ